MSVRQFKANIEEIVSYIKIINKRDNNIQFSPVVSKRILSVLRHFIQLIICFHTVPDISLINRDPTTDLIESYGMCRQFKDDDTDKEIIIDLPTLKSHKIWIQYRDKFISNLSNSSGSNGIPLLYVVDGTPRRALSRNNTLLEEPTLVLNLWNVHRGAMVHFGSHFKRDNNKVL